MTRNRRTLSAPARAAQQQRKAAAAKNENGPADRPAKRWLAEGRAVRPSARAPALARIRALAPSTPSHLRPAHRPTAALRSRWLPRAQALAELLHDGEEVSLPAFPSAGDDTRRRTAARDAYRAAVVAADTDDRALPRAAHDPPRAPAATAEAEADPLAQLLEPLKRMFGGAPDPPPTATLSARTGGFGPSLGPSAPTEPAPSSAAERARRVAPPRAPSPRHSGAFGPNSGRRAEPAEPTDGAGAAGRGATGRGGGSARGVGPIGGRGVGIGLGLGGGSLKLDLSRLAGKRQEEIRLDPADRAPLTPTAEIISRIKSEASSAGATAGSSAGAPAGAPAGSLGGSPGGSLGRSPSIGRTLAELSISEISEARIAPRSHRA